MGKEIKLTNVTKKYGNTTILEELSLTIQAGERVVLLGPSGSGKSTLLRMIAGLEPVTSGELYLGDQLANPLACGDRDITMVFQNYALYPHMTVEQNITFALKANHVSNKEIDKRLADVLEMLNLLPYRSRLPRDLSGGQRQRVALARAVVKRAEYFLLDEPLSNLDVRLRLDARMELVTIHETYHQTFVYVTHDQIEAMTLADRIVLLNNGKIQMVDTPRNVYLRPENVFTATFIGSPGMNIVEVKNKWNQLIVENQQIDLGDDWRRHLLAKDDAIFYLGLRPEHIKLSRTNGLLRGEVIYRELLGQNYALTVRIGKITMIALDEQSSWKIGEEVFLNFSEKQYHFFDRKNEKNLGYPFEIEEGEGTNEIFTSI